MTVLSSQLHTKFTHHNRAVVSRNTNIVYNFLFFFFFFDYLLFNLCLCVHSVRNPSGFTIGIFEYEYTHTAQPIWDDQTKIWTLLVFVAAVTSLEPFFVAPKISRSPNSIFAVQMLCSTRVFIQNKRNSTNCSTYFLCCDHAIQINWTTNCLWFVRVSLCLWIRLIHRDSSILSGLFKCQISHGWKKAHTIFTCIKENFFSVAKWQSVNKIKSLRFFSDEFSTLFKLCASVYVSVYD